MVVGDHLLGGSRAPLADVAADPGKGLPVGVDATQRAHHRGGIGLEEVSGLEVADPVGEAPEARGGHRHAQHHELRERVVEGLRDDAHQQAHVRVDVGHVHGQLVDLVLAHHVHVVRVLEALAHFPGSHEVDLGEAPQLAQRILEELHALGLGELSEHEDAEAVVRGFGHGQALERPAVAVGDGGDGDLAEPIVQPREVGRHGAARGGQGHVGPAHELHEPLPHPHALIGQEAREGVEARVLPVALGDAPRVAAAAYAVEVQVDRRAVGKVVVHHDDGGQARVERIQGVPDERGDKQRAHAVLREDLLERAAILRVGRGRAVDRDRELPRLQRRLARGMGEEGEPAPGGLVVGEGLQDEVHPARVGPHEILEPFRAASAQVVDHVQLDRPLVPRLVRHGREFYMPPPRNRTMQ